MGNFMYRLLSLFVAVIAFLVLSSGAFAANILSSGVQQSFDWQKAWGDINFYSSNDDGIPSSQLQPKADIKNAVNTCGTTTSKVDLIKTYKVDFSGSGKQGIITDASGYFSQYMKSDCALQICNADDGCYLSLYVTDDPTDIITQAKDSSQKCPKSASDNTSCISSCPATVENCPALFQYNMRGVYDQRVFAWTFMQSADFQTWSAGSSYQLNNANPVLAVKLNNKNCYNDELTMNNNQCIKYYQYVGDYGSGSFIDLYNYVSATTAEYDTRFSFVPFDRQKSYKARGMAMGDGFGIRLNHGATLDTQLSSFSRTNADGSASPAAFVVMHIVNNSSSDIFIPTKTDAEFSSFLNAASRLGVSISGEQLKFTDWTGDTKCPSVVTAPMTIAAQRFCISSTTDYRSCSACTNAANAANGVGWPSDWQSGCSISQQCSTNACVLTDDYVQSVGGSTSYDGTATTVDDCLAGRGFWKTTTWGGPSWGALNVNNGETNGWSWASWCTATFSELCSGEIDCVAGGVMIRMADGTERPIESVKAGDLVLGFKDPNEILKPYKVKLVAITPKQKLLEINDTLRVSLSHKVILSSGRQVRASKLKVGDKLLKGDGSVMTVTGVKDVSATATVYNLKLEDGGIGFVANDTRVMEYKK